MEYKVWTGNSHATVVAEYKKNGVTYVEVVFDAAPGTRYTYIKE